MALTPGLVEHVFNVDQHRVDEQLLADEGKYLRGTRISRLPAICEMMVGGPRRGASVSLQPISSSRLNTPIPSITHTTQPTMTTAC